MGLNKLKWAYVNSDNPKWVELKTKDRKQD